jgi:hypothetical protein
MYQPSALESPLSESETPVEEFPSDILESATPIEDKRTDIDAHQLILKLYIQAALKGDNRLPQWDGLAGALQGYFAHGWQNDRFTLEECEQKKSFLFWNAVADAKMRASRGC